MIFLFKVVQGGKVLRNRSFLRRYLKYVKIKAEYCAFQRLNDSLIELTVERRNAILEEVSMAADWSAQIVEEATLDDLEPQALMMARFHFKQVHPDLNADVDTWDDMKLLTHAGIASHGKLTKAALILLGKSSSAILLNPAVVQVTWILKDDARQESDMNESFMTSQKEKLHRESIRKASGKESARTRILYSLLCIATQN